MGGRRRCGASIRLAALGLACAPMAMAEEVCPEGFYRSAPIIFSCSGSSGLAHMLLPARVVTDAVSIGEGVRFFSVLSTGQSGGAGTAITTPGSIEAEFYDPVAGATVASAKSGGVNSSSPLGEFRGVGVVFSTSGGDGGEENLYVLGALPAPLTLRFRNTLTTWAAVAMKYSYDGNQDCPATPSGCSVYDESFARSAVANWSHWAQAEYRTPAEAWEKLGADHARSVGVSDERGVEWYRWPAVFSGGADDLGSAKPALWQPSFQFLDADGNGGISQREFEAAYAFYGSKAQSIAELLAQPAPLERTELVIASLAALATLGIAVWMAYWWYSRGGFRKKARIVVSRSSELDYDEEPYFAEKGAMFQGERAPVVDEAQKTSPPAFDSNGGSGYSTGVFASDVYSGGTGSPVWVSFWRTVQPLLPFGQQHSPSFRYGPVASEEPLSSRGNMGCASEPVSRGAGLGMHMGGVGMQGQHFQQSASFGTLQPGNGASFTVSGAGSVHAPGGGSFQAPSASFRQQPGAGQSRGAAASRRPAVQVPIEPVAEPPSQVGSTAGGSASASPAGAATGPSGTPTGANRSSEGSATKEQIDEVKKKILEKRAPGVSVYTPEDSGFYSGWARFVQGRRRLGQTAPPETSEWEQTSRGTAADGSGLPLLQWPS